MIADGNRGDDKRKGVHQRHESSKRFIMVGSEQWTMNLLAFTGIMRQRYHDSIASKVVLECPDALIQ